MNTYDQRGQTVYGDQYNVAGNLTISQPAGARVAKIQARLDEARPGSAAP